MRRLILIILATLLALGAIEGIAWWWMHPAPAGLGEPVLAYRPQVNAEKLKTEKLKEEAAAPAHDPAQSSSSISSSQDFSVSAFQLLPELVSRSIPSLGCSTGTAARIDRHDGIIVHVAFFEWDMKSSRNTLEVFKHLPEECLGSIGMELVKIHPPRRYQVRGRETGVRNQESANLTAQSSSPNQQSTIVNPQSSISSSSSDHSLSFDHTEFRDPSGKTIHAFKGVWVSGAANLLGDSLRGGMEQWRQIRFHAALKRFRPAHARVAQGAILGIANPDRAWEIFEESMLRDLTFVQ